MGRKKGCDNKKIVLIVSLLARNPEGLWLRRLAKEAGLSPMTVSKYADTVLKPLIEDVSLGNEGKSIIRVIRLKSLVIERLRDGKDLNQILKILAMMEKVS